MDFEHKIYLSRSQNELNLSIMIMRISDDKELQVSIFGMKEDTYYSATISHAYYSIFYAAKAYLSLKGIKTQAPEEHKKTYDEFSKFVNKDVIDLELLRIYQNMFMKADILLSIWRYSLGISSNWTWVSNTIFSTLTDEPLTMPFKLILCSKKGTLSSIASRVPTSNCLVVCMHIPPELISLIWVISLRASGRSFS